MITSPSREWTALYLLCDVVDEESTGGTTVITSCNGAEAFLACRIPELQLDTLVADLDETTGELDANSVG